MSSHGNPNTSLLSSLPDRSSALVQLATRHAKVSVPVLPQAVREHLRSLGAPVRLFGENLAQVRERLRTILAQQHVLSASAQQQHDGEDDEGHEGRGEEQEEVTQYTRATPPLLKFREQVCNDSLERSWKRLERERLWRSEARKRKYDQGAGYISTILDKQDTLVQQTLDHEFTLQGSQYADTRSLSSLVVCRAKNNTSNDKVVVTASWNAQLKVWNANTLAPILATDNDDDATNPEQQQHADRIMGLAVNQRHRDDTETTTTPTLLCSTSLDTTAKIWKWNSTSDRLVPVVTLSGHAQRLAQAAFHPHVPHVVATTSYDHTWRLWDVETNTAVFASPTDNRMMLLQDGHGAGVHGIDWHPDGSICVTADTSGVVHAWDIRTSKSIRHWITTAAGSSGSRRRIYQVHAPASGIPLWTGDDTGTLRMYDWRRPQRPAVCIPAHGNVITRIASSGKGGVMVTSSFDGTVKLWTPTGASSTCVRSLQGHEGTVSGVEFVSPTKLVSCGYDTTLKLWC